LIDNAIRIFDCYTGRYRGQIGAAEFQSLRLLLDKEWEDQDIIDPDTLADILKQLPLSDNEKTTVHKEMEQYREDVRKSSFGKQQGTS